MDAKNIARIIAITRVVTHVSHVGVRVKKLVLEAAAIVAVVIK